jgi:hypothetical protein
MRRTIEELVPSGSGEVPPPTTALVSVAVVDGLGDPTVIAVLDLGVQ